MRIYTSLAKIIACLLFIPILNFPLNAKDIQTNEEGKTELRLLSQTVDNLKFLNKIGVIGSTVIGTEMGDFARLQIAKFTKSNALGFPELPVRRKLIEIPHGAELVVNIIGYEVKEYSLSELNISCPIIPCQPSEAKCGNASDFIRNDQSYQIDGFSNIDRVTVDVLGIMRGVRIARVNVSPVEYNPVKNTIRVYENLEFEITFKNADWGTTDFEKQRLQSHYFKPLFNKLPNYSQTSTRENLTKYPVKYLIVSDPMFEAQLQPFIEWKRQKGFTVVEGYTDVIGSTKEEIKDFIKDLYDEGTTTDPAPSFVLFVGDINQMPTWNNGNGVTDRNYVEYTNDLFPEIFYGRFSANNAAQLQPFIDKTLQYEQYTMPDPSYLEEVVMVAGADANFAQDWGNGQITYGTENYFNPDHGILSHTYLYPQSASSSAAIIQDISNGVTFANYTAHCGPGGWSDPSFSISDIAGLQNQDKYGLLIGNCCSSSEYQTTCFAEEIVRAENKGAVGYIGGSNSTFWDEDYYFGVGVGQISEDPPNYEETTMGNYDCQFHDHGEEFGEWFTTMDQIVFAGNFAVSESGSSSEEYYWDIYNLMGDPSLMVYHGVPEELEADYNPFLLIGSDEFSVSTTPYAYVALNEGNELKAVALADANGIANLEFEAFVTPGNAELVITAQNRQPFIEEVMVIAPEGAFCIYVEHTINDDSLANGNNRADHDERVFINLSMKNFGNDDAHDVQVIVESPDPYINIIDDSEAFDTIHSDQTVLGENGFLIELADNIPDQREIMLNVTATDALDSSWVSQFTVRSYAPELTPKDMEIIDVETGNGDGRLDPGESAVIRIITANTGHCFAYDVSASLVAYNPFITVLSGDTVIQELSTLNAAVIDFEVTVSEDAPAGIFGEMKYELNAGGYNVMKSYYPRIGLMYEDWEQANFDQFNWQMGGDAGWVIDYNYQYEGYFSAASGTIGDNSSSELTLTYDVMLDDSIVFYKKVSSEDNFDELVFYIDNHKKADWNGNDSWTRESFSVNPGTHNFTWKYKKDYAQQGGLDKAWIDYIVFPTMLVTTVFSGPDDEVCKDQEYFQCIGTATNYDSIYWITNGSGYFSDENTFNPQYVLSEDDKANGELQLSLNIIDADGIYASDTMMLTVNEMAAIPSIPEGPLEVNAFETPQTEYFTEAVEYADSYNWSLSPVAAGIISGEEVAATVNWNASYEGEAWIKVATVNDCGMSEFSDSLMIIVSELVGLPDREVNFNMQLVPNPNNGKFRLNISAENKQVVYLSVVNYLGQSLIDHEVISFTGKRSITYDLSNEEAGIYFVILQNGEQRHVKKLVINR